MERHNVPGNSHVCLIVTLQIVSAGGSPSLRNRHMSRRVVRICAAAVIFIILGSGRSDKGTVHAVVSPIG